MFASMRYSIAYRYHRLSERLLMAIAWALPKKLVMWCAVRVGAHATTGPYSGQIVPDLKFVDALDRWI